MQQDFWPNSKAMFAETREGALARLAEFSRAASRYSRDRNHVVPGHTNVSRLSPAIRCRLISEQEAAQSVLGRYAFSTVEKFLQEIYWRRYWKEWLAMRPQVWTEYLLDVERLQKGEDYERAWNVSEGRGPIAVMNDFAHELRETGYLHNHARMWFAAYWIHTLRLPWQLGANFFYRHLLDADPASNTLSWRWVGGLQTIGKSYLARRSNIEKYLHPDLLRTDGLELLEKPMALHFEGVSRPEVITSVHAHTPIDPKRKTALWLHEEDLSVETWLAPESLSKVERVVISKPPSNASPVKKAWLEKAMNDGASRWNLPVSFTEEVLPVLEKYQISQVMTARPEIGPLNDEMPTMRASLEEKDVSLHFLERQEDQFQKGLSKSGFFSFWKKIETHVRSLKK